MYSKGVARVQMSFKLCTPAFFTKGCADLKEKMFSYHARARTAKRLRIEGLNLENGVTLQLGKQLFLYSSSPGRWAIFKKPGVTSALEHLADPLQFQDEASLTSVG